MALQPLVPWALPLPAQHTQHSLHPPPCQITELNGFTNLNLKLCITEQQPFTSFPLFYESAFKVQDFDLPLSWKWGERAVCLLYNKGMHCLPGTTAHPPEASMLGSLGGG